MATGNTILLAENNPDDVLLIKRVFNAIGLTETLVAVRNGEEAVSYLKGLGRHANQTQSPLPALILLDLDMPRMSGFQVLVWLRQQPELRHLPVIVLTTSVFSSDVKTAYLLGANSFLTKPADFTAFVPMIRQMCDFWLGPCRLPEAASAPGTPAAE